MDDQFNAHITKLVDECLASSAYSALSESDKQAAREKLENHLNLVVINLLIDSLSAEQLSEVENLPEESSEMEEKFQEFASQIPGFAYVMEEKLKTEVQSIIQGQTKI